jgi:hypothetical protein
VTRKRFLRAGIDRRALAWTAFGAFVGADWGVAFAVMIEGWGGVIPTAASLAMVVALALLGGGWAYTLAGSGPQTRERDASGRDTER